jgi:putative transcriptional regulator
MPSRKLVTDAETLEFQTQLMSSVKQMTARKAVSTKRIKVPRVVSARLSSGLSQARFADLLGISVRTLQKWEQGEREPSGAAKTLIAIAAQHPEVLLQVAL